jgi:hypothetical protein
MATIFPKLHAVTAQLSNGGKGLRRSQPPNYGFPRPLALARQAQPAAGQSMIRKSGNRFSEKIMLKQKDNPRT